MWQRTIALGEMRQRPGRALLTLASVLLGVASVVAVGLAAATTHSGFERMYEAVAGRAALEVVAAAGESFSDNIVASLTGLPGIHAAVPAIQQPVVIYAGSHRVQALALGIDPQSEALVRDLGIAEGRPLTEGRQLLFDPALARSIGVHVGDEVKLLTHRGLKRFKIVGLLTPRGAASLPGGLVMMPLHEAQRVFRGARRVDAVHIVLDEGATPEVVQRDLAAHLPPGLIARPPAARTAIGHETMVTLESGLALTSVMSVLAAAVIILNCFFMNLTERWKQLAVVRTLGGTRRQILGLVLREGAMLGVVGTLLGLLTGVLGAVVLTRIMGTLFQTELPGVELRMIPILAGIALGVVVSLIAVSIPAWVASRITPLEGLQGIVASDHAETYARLTQLGLLLLGLAVFPGLLVSLRWISPKASVWSIVLSLSGLVLLLPVLAGPLVRVMMPLIGRLAGMEGRLASRHVLRHRLRTSLTAGVLLVVTAMNLAVGNSLLNNIGDIKQWYRRTIVGDFFVRAMMPDMTTGTAASMPEELGTRIRSLHGVKTVDEVRFLRAVVREVPVIIVARSYASPNTLPLDLIGGNPLQTLEALRNGQAVISTVLAQRTGLKIGDKITLSTPDQRLDVPIAGLANEYTAGGLVVNLDFRVAQRLLGAQGVDVFLVRVQPESRAEVQSGLAAICKQNGLLLQSFTELSQLADSMLAGVIGGLWVLMAMGFVVASFAVANTLTMSVLEQTRELGLLRMVAMTQRQVRKFVVLQGVVIAAVGVLPGILVGIANAYALNVLTQPVSGHPVEFVLRPQIVVGCFVVSFAIVLAAAYLPARRAARLNIIEAIQYE